MKRYAFALLLAAATGCASATRARNANVDVPASDPRHRTVMAVVDSALHFINTGNMSGVADLMIPEAQMFPAQVREGAGGTYTVRTVTTLRTMPKRSPILERGYNPTVRVSGTIASVWLPYDLWTEGKWSHCGVDLLMLVQVGSSWRIANFSFTVEQPPVCAMHPDGVPPGYKAPPVQ